MSGSFAHGSSFYAFRRPPEPRTGKTILRKSPFWGTMMLVDELTPPGNTRGTRAWTGGTLEEQIEQAVARYGEKKDPAVRDEIEHLNQQNASGRTFFG